MQVVVEKKTLPTKCELQRSEMLLNNYKIAIRWFKLF